jgi:hypothetical protein
MPFMVQQEQKSNKQFSLTTGGGLRTAPVVLEIPQHPRHLRFPLSRGVRPACGHQQLGLNLFIGQTACLQAER